MGEKMFYFVLHFVSHLILWTWLKARKKGHICSVYHHHHYMNWKKSWYNSIHLPFFPAATSNVTQKNGHPPPPFPWDSFTNNACFGTVFNLFVCIVVRIYAMAAMLYVHRNEGIKNFPTQLNFLLREHNVGSHIQADVFFYNLYSWSSGRSPLKINMCHPQKHPFSSCPFQLCLCVRYYFTAT